MSVFVTYLTIRVANRRTRPDMTTVFWVSPSGGGLGGIPHYPKNWLVPPPCPPTILTQKCRFCHFHAVFGHFVQIVPPLVDPNWETLVFHAWPYDRFMELEINLRRKKLYRAPNFLVAPLAIEVM